MKIHLPLIVGFGLVFTQVSHADEQTRNLQSTLKEAGFYYGVISGENNAETSAAIRRYQIRNSLQVTGELNQETTDSLFKEQTPSGQSAERSPAPLSQTDPAPPPISTPQPRPVSPPALDRQLDPNRQSLPDRPSGPSVTDRPSGSDLFFKSPYDRAPLPVQQETLRRVQELLARRGFYSGPLNGVPSEPLRRGIALYQEAQGVRPTGRLDVDTLHEMRLLPGESSSPFGTGQSRPSQKIYKGIEIR